MTACHRSLTPVERRRQTCWAPNMLPSTFPKASASTNVAFRSSITTAYALAVYASQPGSPHVHARLASGRQASLTRAGLPCRTPKEVSDSTCRSPLPGLAWRTGDRKVGSLALIDSGLIDGDPEA
jgi:hypothetical protein